jgi:dienelactone hydrolase
MKVRILVGVLIVSLLLNVAGLVFFICFLNLNGQYKHVRRERNQMAQNLNMIRGAGVINGLMASEHINKRTFVSQVDGQQDTFGMLLPAYTAANKEYVLVVYLHGMGSNYLEPFFYPQALPLADAIVNSRPATVFMSLSYRGDASWGNDLALADITQNIRQACQEYPVKQIVLMGTSMGGCTALNYAACAPGDIQEKISGVVSVESAGDLTALYKATGHPSLQPAMIRAFGGTPEQIPQIYQAKSFLNNIDSLPKRVQVAVVSARQDDIVPPVLQKQIVDELSKRRIPVKLIEIDGGHGAPPAEIYTQGLDFALSKG